MIELLRRWNPGGPAPDANELTVSGYALGLISQRLRRLDSDVIEMLSAASVIGRSFDIVILSRVYDRPIEAVSALLDSSLAAGVIETRANSTMSFAFSHDLIRRVLYGAIPTAKRMRLHQEVAETLLARGDASESMASTQIADAVSWGALSAGGQCERSRADPSH